MISDGDDEILLGFESSGGKASVAIGRGGDILARTEHVAHHGHATWMLTLARDALAAAGIAPEDCSAVLAGRGPGSFTGIRVALAAAKGMGLALKAPVFGLSSLEAMAGAAADGTHPVAAIADSRRGSFFVDMRSPDGQPAAALQDIKADQVASVLASAAPASAAPAEPAPAKSALASAAPAKSISDWIITGHIAEIPGLEGAGAHALIEDDPDATHLCALFGRLDDTRKADLPLDPLYLSAPLLGPGPA